MPRVPSAAASHGGQSPSFSLRIGGLNGPNTVWLVLAGVAAPAVAFVAVSALTGGQYWVSGRVAVTARSPGGSPAEPAARPRSAPADPYAGGLAGAALPAGKVRDPFKPSKFEELPVAGGGTQRVGYVKARITAVYAGRATGARAMSLPHLWGRVYFFLDWLASMGYGVNWDREAQIGMIHARGERKCLVFAAGSREMYELECWDDDTWEKLWNAANGGIVAPPSRGVERHRIACEPLSFGGRPGLPIRSIAGFLGLDAKKAVIFTGVSPKDGAVEIRLLLDRPFSQIQEQMKEAADWTAPGFVRQMFAE